MKPSNTISENLHFNRSESDPAPKPTTTLPYHWLRTPALIIAMIGILGILTNKTALLAGASEHVKAPPFLMSCLLVGGAMVLYALSMIHRIESRQNETLEAISLQLKKNWRNT